MRGRLLLIIVLVANGFLLSAQTHPIRWAQTFGGAGADIAGNMLITHGGYLISATTGSNDTFISGNHGDKDIWLSMLDSAHNPLWSRCYGGSGLEQVTAGSCLQATGDGNYVFAGGSYSVNGDLTANKGSQDGWIVKIDTAGNILWQKNYGGSRADMINTVQETADSGFLFAGQSASDDSGLTDHHGNNSTSDGWIGKTDKNGNLIWQRSLGGSATDWINKIQLLDDGSIIAGISTGSIDGDIPNHPMGTGYDICLMKLRQSDGQIIWRKMIASSKQDVLETINELRDGTILVSVINGATNGSFSACTHSNDAILMNIDTAGNNIWIREYGGSRMDGITSITETADSGLLMCGISSSNNGDLTQHYGDSTSSDIWILKTNKDGSIRWQGSYGGTDNEAPGNMVATSDSACVVFCSTLSSDSDLVNFTNHGNYDLWLFKIGNDSVAATDNIYNITLNTGGVKLYPTLSNGGVNIDFADHHNYIQFAIVNASGQFVNAFAEKQSDKHYLINNLPTGFYIVHIAFDGYTKDFKVMVD